MSAGVATFSALALRYHCYAFDIHKACQAENFKPLILFLNKHTLHWLTLHPALAGEKRRKIRPSVQQLPRNKLTKIKAGLLFSGIQRWTQVVYEILSYLRKV